MSDDPTPVELATVRKMGFISHRDKYPYTPVGEFTHAKLDDVYIQIGYSSREEPRCMAWVQIKFEGCIGGSAETPTAAVVALVNELRRFGRHAAIRRRLARRIERYLLTYGGE